MMTIGALAIATGFVTIAIAQGNPSSRPKAARSLAPRPERGALSPTTALPVTPLPPSVRLVGADTTTAGYAVTATPAVVTLVAKAPCWIQVRPHDPNTAAIFEATLPADARRTFSDPSGLWIRLGNPGAVTIVVNGVSIDLPAGGHGSAPFDVLVRTSAAATPPSTAASA
jgi:hypothetical protein